MTVPRVPASTETLESVGDDPNRAQQIDTLVRDIYALTGCKITRDDPILVAALLQSSLVKNAGQEAAHALHDAVSQAVADLADAVKVERAQAANLDRTLSKAFQQIADAAKQTGDQELTTMQTRFARMASDTLDQVRREATKQTSGGVQWKFTATLLCGLLIGVLIGVWIGKSNALKMSTDQVRLMHNGMLLDAAWSKLPKAARELVEAAGKPGGPTGGNERANVEKGR